VTTLLVIAGVWLLAALLAALLIGAAMRHADLGERRRLAREHAVQMEREQHQRLPGRDDVRSA
jgi:hypothetical protein